MELAGFVIRVTSILGLLSTGLDIFERYEKLGLALSNSWKPKNSRLSSDSEVFALNDSSASIPRVYSSAPKINLKVHTNSSIRVNSASSHAKSIGILRTKLKNQKLQFE